MNDFYNIRAKKNNKMCHAVLRNYFTRPVMAEQADSEYVYLEQMSEPHVRRIAKFIAIEIYNPNTDAWTPITVSMSTEKISDILLESVHRQIPEGATATVDYVDSTGKERTLIAGTERYPVQPSYAPVTEKIHIPGSESSITQDQQPDKPESIVDEQPTKEAVEEAHKNEVPIANGVKINPTRSSASGRNNSSGKNNSPKTKK